MNAVIYTPSDTEYELFTRILREEAPDAKITRDPDDGFFHYDPEHDFVVVSVDGAKGMEQVIKHRNSTARRWLSGSPATAILRRWRYAIRFLNFCPAPFPKLTSGRR